MKTMKPGTEVWRVDYNRTTDEYELQKGIYDGQSNGWHRVILDRYNNFGLVEWGEHVAKYHGQPPFYASKIEALFVFATAIWDNSPSMQNKIKDSYLKLMERHVLFSACDAMKTWEPNVVAEAPHKPFWKRWLGW